MNGNICTRPAAVAGVFYPASADVLVRDVQLMLDEAGADIEPVFCPKALIVPHAGYVYSGPVAAAAYARSSGLRQVRRVILLGPTHHVPIDGLALPESALFSTPLGTVPVDQEAVARLLGLPQVFRSEAAHAREHAIEVQLPFLQCLLEDFSLIPLAVGHTSAEAVAEVLECLWGETETLIVVSSDLSHYLPYDQAAVTDERTARLILTLVGHLGHQQACGATPVNGLLLAARRHGLTARLIDLRNSGDTSGDRSRVVGYGAFAFCEGGAS